MDDEGWSWVGQGWHRRVTGRGIVRPGAVRRPRVCVRVAGAIAQMEARWAWQAVGVCITMDGWMGGWKGSEAMKQGRSSACSSQLAARPFTRPFTRLWRGVRFARPRRRSVSASGALAGRLQAPSLPSAPALSSNPEAATTNNQTHHTPFALTTRPSRPQRLLFSPSPPSLAQPPIVALLSPWFAWLCFSSSNPGAWSRFPAGSFSLIPWLAIYPYPVDYQCSLPCPGIWSPLNRPPGLLHINLTDSAILSTLRQLASSLHPLPSRPKPKYYLFRLGHHARHINCFF